MATRKRLLEVETPFPSMEKVVLYSNTWHEHVVPNHAEMDGQLEVVKNTLLLPAFVCLGTKSGYFQFVSHTDTVGDGLPTVVVVSSLDTTGNAVATAFGGRKKKYSDKTNFEVVWPPE